MNIKVLNYTIAKHAITYIVQINSIYDNSYNITTSFQFSDLVQLHNTCLSHNYLYNANQTCINNGLAPKYPEYKTQLYFPDFPPKILINPTILTADLIQKRIYEIEDYLDQVFKIADSEVKAKFLFLFEKNQQKIQEIPSLEISNYDRDVFIDESFAIKKKKKLIENKKKKTECKNKENMGILDWLKNNLGCCNYQ